MKKAVALLVAFLVLGAVLTGCASGPATTESTSTGSSSASSQTTDANTEIIVTVYAGTAPIQPTVDEIVADYKAQTGVTIEWEIPGDEPYTLLKTRFASGEGPDIFEIQQSDLVSWGVRCEDLSNEDWIAHTDTSAVTASTIDGAVLGMPYAVVGNGIVYNKSLFSQVGIEEVPKTLSELEAVCIQLEDAGIQPFAEAFKEWGFLMHIFGTTIAYEDDPFATSQALNNGSMTIGDLTYIDNFFRLYDLTLDYGLGAESVGYDAMSQIADFAVGNMAMIKQGTWYTEVVLAANPEMEMGLFAVPLTDNPDDTKLMTFNAGFFCISNESEDPGEAKKFLQWLHDNAQKYFVEGAFRAASPYDNVDISNTGPLYSDMFNMMEKGEAFSWGGTEYLAPGFVTDIAIPLQAYAGGSLDQAGAIAALQSAYEDRLAAQQ